MQSISGLGDLIQNLAVVELGVAEDELSQSNIVSGDRHEGIARLSRRATLGESVGGDDMPRAPWCGAQPLGDAQQSEASCGILTAWRAGDQTANDIGSVHRCRGRLPHLPGARPGEEAREERGLQIGAGG